MSTPRSARNCSLSVRQSRSLPMLILSSSLLKERLVQAQSSLATTTVTRRKSRPYSRLPSQSLSSLPFVTSTCSTRQQQSLALPASAYTRNSLSSSNLRSTTSVSSSTSLLPRSATSEAEEWPHVDDDECGARLVPTTPSSSSLVRVFDP